MKTRESKSKIFRMMFISFCVMLTIPILILIFTYHSMISTLETEIKSYNQSLLNECMQSAEDVFAAADRTLNDLAFSKKTKEFLRPASYSGSQAFNKAKNVYQTISGYQELFGFTGILDALIYSGNSGAIVSQIVPYSLAKYYDQIVSFPGSDITFSDFLESGSQETRILSEMQISVYDTSYKAILVFKPVLVGYRTSRQDCVAALIDTEKFGEKLRRMKLGEEGFACIADENGKILLQVHGSQIPFAADVGNLEFPQKAYLQLLTSSPGGDRQYLAYIPKSMVFSQVEYLKVWIIWLCVLEALLGFAGAWLLSWKNMKPILDIFGLLEKNAQSGKTVRDFNFLKGSISKLVDSNQALRDELEKQSPIVRSDFIRRILTGPVSTNALEGMARHLSCDLSGDLYSVLLVKNAGYGDTLDPLSLQELENASVLLRQAFAQINSFRIYSTQPNEQVTALLLIFDEAAPELCRERMEAAVEKVDSLLGDQYHLPLSYFCGGFCKELEQIPVLFENTMSMLEMNLPQTHGGVTMFDPEAPLYRATAIFPLETESRLIKLVLMGQEERIAALVRSVYTAKKDQPFSDTDLRQFNGWMYLAAVRISSVAHDPVLVEEASFLTEQYNVQQIPVVAARVTAMLEQACWRVNVGKARKEGQVNDNVLEFMEKNLAKSTFTLYDMALHFDYAEAYLYRLFREKFGCSFATMLEKMRMERACQALSGGKNIEAVAAECGYNSSHAFRRAFKKYTGMLPSDYRSTFLKEDKKNTPLR